MVEGRLYTEPDAIVYSASVAYAIKSFCIRVLVCLCRMPLDIHQRQAITLGILALGGGCSSKLQASVKDSVLYNFGGL